MFLKNNRYRNLIIAVITTVVVALLAYKCVDNIGFFVRIFKKIYSLSIPFIYGIIIAYILNPLVKLFQKRAKFSKSASIAITYAILLSMLVVVGLYCVPGLVSSIKDIASNIPNYIVSIEALANNILQQEEIQNFITSTGMLVNIESYIDKIGQMAMGALEGSLWTMISLSSILINFVLGLLIAIYILTDKERLLLEVKRVMYLTLKPERSDTIIDIMKTYHSMIGTYIGIKAIDSSIIAGMAFILLTLVKSEYPLLLAILVGVTNMIPYFGPFIGEIIGFLINVFVSPWKAVVVFLVLFGLQNFDGWYLDPKLIGDKVGVRPIWIIYAVVIGGGFFGPIGMLLASPTAATIKIYYHKMLAKHSMLTETEKK